MISRPPPARRRRDALAVRHPHRLRSGRPAGSHVDELATRLREEQESNLLLTEQLVELTADERGWRRLGASVGRDLLTRSGLSQIAPARGCTTPRCR
jgi:hypothetical protein